MNVSYSQVIASILLSFCGSGYCIAQSSGPEFLGCTDSTLRLCVADEGVRLPANNQLFLGEEDPDATSCSVHVIQKKRVRATCGDTLQYEVSLFLNDTSPAILLKPLTNIVVDSSNEVELIFDTALSPDSAISHSGISYSLGCETAYRIVWTVLDSCGQVSSCASNVNVYDCSKPVSGIPATPFIVTIPIGCQRTMHAKDFGIDELDDCIQNGMLKYSFEEDRYNPDSIINCPSAVAVEVPWKIWIADDGVDQNCNGEIEWMERNRTAQLFDIVFLLANDACCEPIPFDTTLTGKISIVNGDEGINQVFVYFSLAWGGFPTYITGIDGKYSFEVEESLQEITITPEKNDRHRNGVTTLDLVKIQKHLLGRVILESPYLLIAADANNSQSVSAIDMIQLRKLILGVYTEFPSNNSWRFVRSDYVFQHPDDPWSDLPWPADEFESIKFTDVRNPGNLDFIGIKIGDVNNTAQPNIDHLQPRNSYPPIKLLTDQQSYKTGDIINVPIRISSDQTISGFQFTMAASEMEVINILPGVIAITEEHFALFGDKFTMSWFDENSIDVSANDILFTVQLLATSTGNLNQSLSINSDITDAELYLENEEIFLPVLTFQNESVGDGLDIISCAPNPWKEETNISFYLPESDQVVFSLFDVAGRKVFAAIQYLKNGNHEFQLNTSCFADRGMMFFEISTSSDKAVRKMIVLD